VHAAGGESDLTIGRNELGTISIGDGVVAKIAARAAAEIPDAGAAATRVLGRALPGAGHLGGRSTDLAGLPKTSADVDGSLVYVTMQLSVRWGASVPTTTARVRAHIQQRVHLLTGLTVAEVNISVTDLVTDLAAPPRVR
jgi:uncharacterized alkaline shock family protein YloU